MARLAAVVILGLLFVATLASASYAAPQFKPADARQMVDLILREARKGKVFRDSFPDVRGRKGENEGEFRVGDPRFQIPLLDSVIWEDDEGKTLQFSVPTVILEEKVEEEVSRIASLMHQAIKRETKSWKPTLGRRNGWSEWTSTDGQVRVFIDGSDGYLFSFTRLRTPER